MQVRWGGGARWCSAETRNIGVGGAFIATDDPPAVGTDLLVELHIPTSERGFEVKAIVRWRQTGPEGDGPGMGVQFIDVDIDVLLELNDYFASLTGLDFTGDQPVDHSVDHPVDHPVDAAKPDKPGPDGAA